jgi:hypothetical protein
MVTNPKDKQDLARMLEFYCALQLVNSWHLDVQGRIDIDGDITILGNRLVKPRLPLKFGRVTGTFIARNCGLDTLEGSPYHVGEHFLVIKNNLNDLTHGPQHVSGQYGIMNNPLHSLDGLASHVGESIWLDYTEQLPLLRLVQVPKVLWHMNHQPPLKVKEIVDKYVGKGRSVILNFALELKQAEYAENARW